MVRYEENGLKYEVSPIERNTDNCPIIIKGPSIETPDFVSKDFERNNCIEYGFPQRFTTI